MAAAKKPEKQVMDISKPGKAPADPTARPVIVGHKPLVKDPMVQDAEAANPDEPAAQESQPLAPSAAKKVITPLSEQEVAEEAEVTEVTPQTETAAEPESVEQPAEATEEVSEEKEQETGESTESVTDSAVVDSVIDQVDIGSKREEEQKAEEERKKQEAIDKLVAEKKYFVPIGKTHHTSNHTVTIITIILFLVFVGLLAAIDAGMLEAGFELPFDLIK